MSQPPATVPSIDVAEADTRARAGAVIVDVREVNEFEQRRVPGAALVPLSSFAARYEELPRDRPLLVMCASGNRSQAATAHLLRNGWTDVVNVSGGIVAWEKAGLPVARGMVAPGEGELPG